MKWRQLIGHLLFWLVIILTYAVSEWGYRDNFKEAMVFELLFLPIRLVAVYINWWLLIPRLLYQNRIIQYLFSLALLLFFCAIVQRYFSIYLTYPFFFPEWLSSSTNNPLIFFRIVQNLVIIASPVAFSTGIKIFIDWYAQKNRSKQLEIEKKQAELKYLKSQINPHFLFNTLNTLYGLSQEESKKVPNLILKLSNFLNYSLYESSVERITVAKEIQLVKDVIELESERYEDRVIIHWEMEEKVLDKKIAPLLFMPLVENAFKHGVREEIDQTTIHIRLLQNKDWLTFEIKNTLPDYELPVSGIGIGLTNLRKRLELLYPNQHDFTISKEVGYFLATLKLRF